MTAGPHSGHHAVKPTEEGQVSAMYGHTRNSHESSGHAFLSGVLIGIGVGAAAGLLFAPKSGAEIRGDMRDSADRLRREAGRKYDEASTLVHDVVERSRDAWREGVETLKDAKGAHGRKHVEHEQPI